jgi:hypothetical protein
VCMKQVLFMYVHYLHVLQYSARLTFGRWGCFFLFVAVVAVFLPVIPVYTALQDNGNGGVAKDFGMALYWFQQAADTGCVPAFKNLGIVYEVC